MSPTRVLGYATLYFFVLALAFTTSFFTLIGLRMTMYSFTLDYLLQSPWFALQVTYNELTRNALTLPVMMLSSIIDCSATDVLHRGTWRDVQFSKELVVARQ